MGLTSWTAVGMAEDCDWREAWAYGYGSKSTRHYDYDKHEYVGRGSREASGPGAQRCEDAECSDAPCDVDDVVRVLAASPGEYDGPAWMAVAVLKDGRYAFVNAGCDYTGWDCIAYGNVWVSHSLDNLVAFGLTQEARERLGDALFSDAEVLDW